MTVTATTAHQKIRSALFTAAVYATFVATAFAQGTVMPPPQFVGFTNAGVPCAGCFLDTYLAGTTTLTPTYTDAALAVPNANPVVLNAAGRGTIYLVPGLSYKVVLRDAAGATIYSQDNLSAAPASTSAVDVLASPGENAAVNDCVYLSDGRGARISGLWYRCSATNVFSSGNAPIIGIAAAGMSTAAGSATVRIEGAVPTMIGFAPGVPFYVSSTPGALSTVVPDPVNQLSVRRLVGYGATPGAGPAIGFIVTANPVPIPLWTITTIALTGTQNDMPVAVAGGTNVVLRCNNPSLLTITGLATGFDGQRVIVESVGAGEVDLSHQNASSVATNRLINFTTSGITPLAPGVGVAEYQYDGTTSRWRLVTHDQGAGLTYTPTYGANGAQTFTGITTTLARYILRGRQLTLSWDFTGTVGGTANTQVTATLPNSYTAAAAAYSVYDAGLANAAIMQAQGSNNVLVFYVDLTAASNWGAGSKRLLGTVTTEVQ